MKMESLKDLYVDQLRDLYSAENQILKVLPVMADKASHPELKTAFQEHEVQTREHVRRLEQVFETLGEKTSGHHCKGMEGLLKEGDELMKMKVESDVLDAGLITSAQRVESAPSRGSWASTTRRPSCSRRWTRRGAPTSGSPCWPSRW
jgi:ferritin-like metal-binding protein YciE